MGVDRSTKQMMTGIKNRSNERENQSLRELATPYYLLCASKKDYIIHKGQGQLGYYFSQRLRCKSAQIVPTKFIVWNFDEWGPDFDTHGDDASLYIHILILPRIYILDIHNTPQKQFIKGSCKKWKRRGESCSLLGIKCLIQA